MLLGQELDCSVLRSLVSVFICKTVTNDQMWSSSPGVAGAGGAALWPPLSSGMLQAAASIPIMSEGFFV